MIRKFSFILNCCLIISLICLYILLVNKTFFRDNYYDKKSSCNFSIPRFSFYVNSSSEAVIFYSVKSVERLNSELEIIYDGVSNDGKIKAYDVFEKGFYREIIIVYK